jgi:ABC-type molybdenum transport system ATPase subunit/photorepair protein PhrA
VNGEYRLLIIDEPGTFMQTNNLPILSELIGPVRDKEAAESLVFVEAAP